MIVNPAFTSHVMICGECGRGFLVRPPGGVDIDPLWRVISTNQEGGVCGGEIRVVDRFFAEKVADQIAKQIGD